MSANSPSSMRLSMQSQDSSEYRVQTVLYILVPLKLPVTQSQQREVKVFTPIHAQIKTEQQWHQQPQTARAFWESGAAFPPFKHSWHNTNRFIISFTEYCYIEILISEHSSDKMNTFIHHCCLCKPPNHSLQKQYYVREKKIHKDIHMLWSTNSTCRDLSKKRIWFCRIIKKTKIIISCCCFGRTVLRC